MYVLVENGGQIFGFGLTPEETRDDFVRRNLWYNGPRLEVRRCSPALYQQLENTGDRELTFMRCRINSDGVAVPLER